MAVITSFHVRPPLTAAYSAAEQRPWSLW